MEEDHREVTIPKSVRLIGDYAFSTCKSLERIIIPSSVCSMEKLTFENCKQVTVCGKKGSYAQSYAQKQGIPFSSNIIYRRRLKQENGKENGN